MTDEAQPRQTQSSVEKVCRDFNEEAAGVYRLDLLIGFGVLQAMLMPESPAQLRAGQSVPNLLKQICDAPAGDPPLCLLCPTPFTPGGDPPFSFAILSPSRDDAKTAIGFCICVACVRRHTTGLKDAVTTKLSTYMTGSGRQLPPICREVGHA
jgi:hypothetical protein